MAISKVILNGETLMDVTSDTVEAGKMLSGIKATKNDGTKVTGSISDKSSSDLIASGATVTVPAGYYSANASKSVASGTAGTPIATKGSVSNHSISITPSVTNTTGYITGGTKNGTAVSVSASELTSGTKTISENGTNIDVTNYALVDVNVESEPNLVPLTVTSSSEEQVFDRSYIVKNLGTVTGNISSGKRLTIPVDLSNIEYGKTYKIKCDHILVGNGSQFLNTIKIDTEWTASENGVVSFEYITHQGDWSVTSITLSKTSLTINYSENNSGLSFTNIDYDYSPYGQKVHEFVVYGIADGFNPVTVGAVKLGSKTVQASDNYPIIIRANEYASHDFIASHSFSNSTKGYCKDSYYQSGQYGKSYIYVEGTIALKISSTEYTITIPKQIVLCTYTITLTGVTISPAFSAFSKVTVSGESTGIIYNVHFSSSQTGSITTNLHVAEVADMNDLLYNYGTNDPDATVTKTYNYSNLSTNDEVLVMFYTANVGPHEEKFAWDNTDKTFTYTSSSGEAILYLKPSTNQIILKPGSSGILTYFCMFKAPMVYDGLTEIIITAPSTTS